MKHSGLNNTTLFLHFYWLFLPDASDIMLFDILPQYKKYKILLGW